MSLFAETLQTGLAALDIELEASVRVKLERHWRLVAKYNQKFNLTAIHEEDEAARKHYLDCLLLLPRLRELTQQQGGALAVADLGSGAGFPGLVLAAACPQSGWLLIEANGKKCGFLQQCMEELHITNARVRPLRAEQAGHDPELRGRRHLVTARAVSNLSVLLEYAAPLLQEGGVFAALKGPALAEEEAAAANALAVLGMQPAGRQAFTLPSGITASDTVASGETRLIAWYQKTAPTPEKYPRRAGLPEKRPL